MPSEVEDVDRGLICKRGQFRHCRQGKLCERIRFLSGFVWVVGPAESRTKPVAPVHPYARGYLTLASILSSPLSTAGAAAATIRQRGSSDVGVASSVGMNPLNADARY